MKNIILLIIPFFISSSSFASMNCTTPSWIENPTLRSGKFEAKLTSTCTVSGNANLTLGEKYFLDETQTKSKKIFEGPKTVMFQNLKATFFDVLTQVPEGTIRSHVTVSEPTEKNLFYKTKSTSINLGGFAGYLKNLDLEIEIEKTSNSSSQIILKNRIVVEKPWIAPGAAFKPIAEKTAKDQFLKNRDEMLPGLVQALRK